MQLAFQSFSEGIRASKDADSLRVVTSAVLEAFDIKVFTYFSLPQTPGEGNILVTTVPSAWLRRYLTQRYDLIDPVLLHASKSTTPLLQVSAPADSSARQLQLFKEAASYGLRSAFVVPFRGAHNEFAGFVVTADDPAVLRRTVALYRWPIMFVGAQVHLQAQSIFASIGGGVVQLLTPREFECLQWATSGKSHWEISRILGISKRTVSFHLDNAKEKLNVRTLREAAIRLMLLG